MNIVPEWQIEAMKEQVAGILVDTVTIRRYTAARTYVGTLERGSTTTEQVNIPCKFVGVTNIGRQLDELIAGTDSPRVYSRVLFAVGTDIEIGDEVIHSTGGTFRVQIIDKAVTQQPLVRVTVVQIGDTDD